MIARRTKRAQTLPLGIDIGAERVRVALAHRTADGGAELIAVATRRHENAAESALIDAVAELRTRERRCVLGLGEPRALLRNIRFPAMRRAEHERAARFEAAQFIDYPIHEAIVRVVSRGSDGDTVIGVVRKDVVHGLVSTAHSAKLRLIAIDDEAFALRRALPDADAVLDIGADDSRLHVFAGRFPIARRFTTGGNAFTQAIAHAFGADEATAARRKLSHGIAGCADGALDRLVTDLAEALVECRATGIGDVRNIAIIGNGSRVSGLAEGIERATAVRVRTAVLEPTISRTLPPDVVRAAAPDWCLAYGLALWTAA